MYHNSANETDPELTEYRHKAKRQDDVILDFFEVNHMMGHAPSEVWRYVLPNAPLTSIRRSMTNLTNEGKLVKTDKQRKGIYGRNEGIWTLPEAARQMRLI